MERRGATCRVGIVIIGLFTLGLFGQNGANGLLGSFRQNGALGSFRQNGANDLLGSFRQNGALGSFRQNGANDP